MTNKTFADSREVESVKKGLDNEITRTQEQAVEISERIEFLQESLRQVVSREALLSEVKQKLVDSGQIIVEGDLS